MRAGERAANLLAAALGLGVSMCTAAREESSASTTSLHPPGIVDPQSPDRHGALLRAARWAPMLDGSHSEACGRCHDGAPARPPGVRLAAPGATDCRRCHVAAQGPLACDTCHGGAGRAYPPRGAHAVHVEGQRLACETCHPVPDVAAGVIRGTHGNGGVEILFDPTRIAGEASYDRDTGRCAVACHDRGGARARPAWADGARFTCGDCHGAPPARHPSGPCNACHAEANPSGTALAPGSLHGNGRIDLGDGSGACGACHGRGADPWPRSGAHRAHQEPGLASPVACGTCHPVPETVRAPGHLDGKVQVTLTGRALDRQAAARWDGDACRAVACHGAGLTDPPPVAPSWNDASGAARACGACHGVPPLQHTPSTSCDRATCHGDEVARAGSALSITAAGRARHADGVIDTDR